MEELPVTLPELAAGAEIAVAGQLFAVRFRRPQIVFRVLYTRAHFLFKLPLHWSA